MNKSSIKYALLAELLRSLEAEGFAFGVDKHLQLQQLLQQLPDDISAEQLKQSLAPAIVSNEQEQSFFYLLFDQALERVESVQAQTFNPPTPPPPKGNWILPALSFLTLLIIPLIWMLLFPPPNFSKTIHKPFSAYLDSSYTVCLDELSLQEFDAPVEYAYLCTNNTIRDSSLVGNYQLNKDFCLQYTAGDSLVENAAICTQFIFGGADTLTVYFEPQLSTPPTIEKDSLLDPNAQARLFDYKDYPIRTDILALKIPELDAWQQFYSDYYKWLKLLFALIACMIAALYLLYRAQKRRKLVAEVQQQDNPPFIWNIETKEKPLIDVGNNFDNLLNGLRKRAESDHRVFDAEKTIQATVESAGMIDFQYAKQTRPPEYLLLIDRESGDSHRARFFDYLQARFLENEVFVHRYFYDNDLRRVWNEQNVQGLHLKELGRFHPDARLIIVGNAYQLLSPLSGKLAKWAIIVNQWKERALLSPIPSSKWGRREMQLGKEFVVLPASPDSLHFLVDQWDQGEEAEFEKWRNFVKDAPAEAITWQGDLMASLEQHYSPAMLRWIAACAVYPSLHWDATLFLGDQLATLEAPLLSLENLHQLNHLDWFVQGEIPQQARIALLNWLEQTHPESLQIARASLFELLQENPPPKDSAAFEDYQLNKDLNEWLITSDRGQKRALEESISSQIDAGAEPDFTVIKYLERTKTPLDFIVPDSFKKYVYNSGFKGLGLRRIQHDLLWALPILAMLLSFVYLWSPPLPGCEGKKVVFLEEEAKVFRSEFRVLIDSMEQIVGRNNARPEEELLRELSDRIDTSRYSSLQRFSNLKKEQYPEDLTLCIKNTADSILYAEYRSRLFVESGLYKEAAAQSDIVAFMQEQNKQALDSAYIAYQKNTSVAYWNTAIPAYQALDSLNNPTDSLYIRTRAGICKAFQNAYLLDSLNNDTRRAMDWCNYEFTPYFEMSPSDCCAPCNITFTNLSEGANRYYWDFGDGQISTDESPRHRYNKAGTYTIRLEVYDGNNNPKEYERSITICETPRVSIPPNNNQENTTDITADFQLYWQYPQSKSTTVSEAKKTISIDIKSNRSITTKNLLLYLHGEKVSISPRDLRGGSPKNREQVRSYSYTLRKDITLKNEGDNAVQLAILDKDAKEIASSEEQIFILKTSNDTPNNPPPTTTDSRYMWCIDNQHGENTPGKRSPVFKDNKKDNQLFEYEFNRAIAAKVISLLKQEGIQYFEVTPERKDIALKERLDRVNNLKSDLPKRFISISSNLATTAKGSEWSEVSGIETWYFERSPDGVELARIFQKNLVTAMGWNDRGIKPSARIYSLKNSVAPALLLELGFLNNEAQVKELMKDTIRQKLAQAIVDAILEAEGRNMPQQSQRRY